MLRWAVLIPLALLLSSCSIKKYAINKVGDALAGTGTTFASDDDPELIRSAVPFSLKLVESLLAENPRHEGWRVMAVRPRDHLDVGKQQVRRRNCCRQRQ